MIVAAQTTVANAFAMRVMTRRGCFTATPPMPAAGAGRRSLTARCHAWVLGLSTYHSKTTTFHSPVQHLMGHRLRCKLPVHYEWLRLKAVDPSEYQNILRKRLKAQRAYDKCCKKLPTLSTAWKRLQLNKVQIIIITKYVKYNNLLVNICI